MACPSGCLNGGGQIKAVSTDAAAHLEAVTAHNNRMSERFLITSSKDIDELLDQISSRYPNWENCDFHPIDQNDPMV
jgi:iron only hydrogenase large subunit-like protein